MIGQVKGKVEQKVGERRRKWKRERTELKYNIISPRR